METDGRRTHLTAAAFESDRLRDQRLLADGWRVMRVTWRQLSDDPRRITDAIGRLLAAQPSTHAVGDAHGDVAAAGDPRRAAGH